MKACLAAVYAARSPANRSTRSRLVPQPATFALFGEAPVHGDGEQLAKTCGARPLLEW
jgi:hypothetical protein